MPRMRFSDGRLVYGVPRGRGQEPDVRQKKRRARGAPQCQIDGCDGSDRAPVVTYYPCRCGCGRVGDSRDYRGFASRSCLERGEER